MSPNQMGWRMQDGVLQALKNLKMKWLVLTWLLLLFNQSQAAPKNAVTGRLELANQEPLKNPLLPGPDEFRLLQNYLKSVDKMDRDPEGMTREQVLLYLFAMCDYDKSGKLDGLELMQLISDVVSHNSNWPPSPDAVSLIVDEVLEKQDLDQDGLLNPSELLSLHSDAPLAEQQQGEAPSIVLQPPHAIQPVEAKDPSLELLDQGVPAIDGGAALAQQGAEVPVHLGEPANVAQNPPFVQHEEPANLAINVAFAEHEEPANVAQNAPFVQHVEPAHQQDTNAYENVQIEEEVAELVVDENQEPQHGAFVPDHEM